MAAPLTQEQRQDLEMYTSLTEGQAVLLTNLLNNILVINPNASTLKSLRERGLLNQNVISLTVAGAALARRADGIINAEGKYGGKCDHAVYKAVEKLRRLAPQSLGRKYLGLTSERVKIVLAVAVCPGITWGHLRKAFGQDDLNYLIDNRWLNCRVTHNDRADPSDVLHCTNTVLVLLKRTAEKIEVS